MSQKTQRLFFATALVLALTAGLALALGAWPERVQAQEDGLPQLAGDVSANNLEWVFETVDSEGDVGQGASLAIDGSDMPHIAYHDSTLDHVKYAVWNGSDWAVQVAAENAGPQISLALDDVGVPHIAYTIRQPEVGYATFDGTTWITESVDGPAAGPSIAVDGAGNPHMAYCGIVHNVGLKYAYWSEGHGWSTDFVTTEACSAPALELDSSDTPHIAFHDTASNSLKYAVWNGATWDIGTVEEGDVPSLSLALDASDTPHVAYVRPRDGPELAYAVLDGNTWITETVEGWAAEPSLAIRDLDGRPRIVACDPRPLPPGPPGRGMLWSSRSEEGVWDSWSLFEILCGGPSLAFIEGRLPAIAFYDTEENSLKYASLQFVPSYELFLRVNYAHDWVEGDYEPGYTLWLTLTNEIGEVKATAGGQTGPIPWWGDQNGFSTNYNVPWAEEQPDMQPGHWVHGTMDNGYTSTVQIGEISGELDIDADTVSGTIHAPWFTEPLHGGCSVWVEEGPFVAFTVDPDGGTYFCDFGEQGWDLLSGQQVAVHYDEPNGNQVINVFEEPAPHLRVEKWADGQPAAGGNFAFRIRYCNHGAVDAEDVVISDTMMGMSYLSDTSGLVSSGSGSAGDPLVWDVGTVEADQCVDFDVFVQVTAPASQGVSNVAEISAPLDAGPEWDKRSEWEGHVQANDTHLSVNKWPWTWDPVAGGDTVFQIVICNHGATSSSQVLVTDTLQAPLSLQSWWSDSPGWEEVSRSDQQLVVSRPTIGQQCQSVFVHATVDAGAQPGDPISNTAVIYAANDLSLDDNEVTWEGQVGEPRTNLSIDKHWGHGQIIPGGQLNYWVHVHNSGNTSITGAIRITDTLPASTSFYELIRQDQWGQHPVTPVASGADYVVWELEGLDNGFSQQFMVTLDVDSDAIPGTLLVNRVEISPQPDEENYEDNVSSWSETLNPAGPNLRVRKEGRWDDWGEHTRRASYWMSVENVGDTTISPVVITDTYPVGMQFEGWVDAHFWEHWEWQDHGDHFTVTLDRLRPGWNVNIHFAMIADDDPLPFGLTFTNSAEVTMPPGDTNPEDNSARSVLTSGPDLFVEKTLAAGVPKPGEMITFTLRFGNDREGNEWWWGMQGNAILTDTLPAGMEYVSAHLHHCGPGSHWCEFEPDIQADGQLIWNLWPLNPPPAHWEQRWDNEIRLTVRILEDAEPGLVINRAEIASDQPDVDIEPSYDNNSVSLGFHIQQALYQMYMPLVIK